MRWRLTVLAATIAPSLALAQPPDRPAAAPAQANAPAIPVRTVYRIKQEGGGLGVFVDEATVISAVGQGSGRVWVAEQRRRDERLERVTYLYRWIDGRACPALAAAIEAMGRIPPAPMAGAAIEPQGWISDTPQVTLIGPTGGGRAGDLQLRRDLAGPVSNWWWEAAKTLQTCWRPTKPYIAGAYDLRARLASAEDEVAIMRPD